ncbi:Npt1/Npt2 family nucleotide transporter [Candidatus Villigracilis affinis]|uniref:Npt1/Npt2 family nucleotide transporter n=1 Tax=Candidatus Villigracilis affinis TaxID=3140682 RepID=UPI001DDAF014|nr:cyclic nucleotide-binding domain-containing protein [Anaerolineales bacterium]
MISRILAALNIREGEARTAFMMLAQYFFMGAAMLFVQSASFALFFTAWDATAMPYIYLGIAVIVSSITALFLKISERTSLAQFLVLSVLFLLFGTVALRIGLAVTASKWLMLILPIWSQTLVNISVTAFWTLAGYLFDVRQGKRIFGLMNAGSWLAYVIMGPFTTPLVKAIGTENLYIVVALCVLVSFILQQITLKKNPRTYAKPESSEGETQKTPILHYLRNKYIFLIFALITTWRVSYFILDNIFYDRAALRYPSTAELAGFIGGFFGLVGLLGFITDMFLTGRIISRFGLRAGLLATPALTVLCTAALAVTGIINPNLILLLFWLAVAGKFANEGVGFSLDQTASALLYQPIAENDRIRAQTITEGIVQPLAIGLAGALLLLFNTILKFNAIQLSFVYLLSGAIWIIICLALIRAYPNALTEALHKHRFGDKGIPLADLVSKEIVVNALKSPHPNEALYALELLEKSGSENFVEILTAQLSSPYPEVRIYAAKSIERLNIVEALPEISTLVKRDAIPNVRQAAACTWSALTVDTSTASKLLISKDPSTLRGTVIGLLRTRNTGEVPEAFQHLNLLTQSKSPQERTEAAYLLAEISNPQLYEVLLPLLQDESIEVKKSALRAAAKTRHPAIYPLVIIALASPQTRSLAFNALVAGKEIALPEIIKSIKDETLHRRIHLRLVRACSHIKGDAIHALESWINHHNVNLRSRVLTALHDCRYKPEGRSMQLVQEQVEVELRRAAWLLSCLSDLQQSKKTEPIIRAFNDDLIDTRDRLFLLFGFVYGSRAVHRARAAITHQDVNRTAYAIEVMDATLLQAHKTAFIPLLENFPAAERLQKMGARFKQENPRAGRIIDILTNRLAHENPWLVANAIEIARELGITESKEIIESLAASKESLIVRIAKQKKTEKNMLSTIERVIILKSLRMFADTPDEALAELADLLQEMDVLPGETVIKEGETGESLYIIVDGKVEVVDDNRVLNQLGARAVFGELSLLDSSPRSATVRALEETSLLRLDQTPFYEIMSDYVEVAMGTIHMLTRNLRARTGDVLELSRILGQ